ncbi:MAG: SEC-C metal-binding domain-containing protein [Desulfuromonadaceae bacterium]|nr:SEC-C metal-binding domain-containing protein [Desulfuromonadaceae bacterium]
MKTGRNDPCPCGSGLKYKKCCADKENTGGQQTGTGSPLDGLRELLKGQNFGSLDEANAFISQHMQQQNKTVIDDFHGLSSEQMHRFLHFPFESPELATFPSRLDVTPKAPILTLFNLLTEAIGDDGLKMTATGNLPRNFCREAAKVFWGEDEYARWSRHGELRSEDEFAELNTARLVAGLAGLIRKYKGKFIIGKECRKVMAEQGMAGIYPRLFRSFVKEYNWGYGDRMQEIPMVQHSFLFTLHLLNKYGAEWRSSLFYEDNFLQAFPMVLKEVPEISECYSPEKTLRSCYSWRCLERFARFMGLVEVERDPANRYTGDFRLRKLPLLDHVVQLHL